MIRLLTTGLVGALCLATGLPDATAQAVGVYRGTTGPRSASMAGADSVAGSTPSEALAWNPAGLTDATTRVLEFALEGRGARGSFSNQVDGNGVLTQARGLVPDAAVAVPLRRGLVAGGALLVDGAVAGSWQYHDVPGIADATYGLTTHRSGVVVLRPTAGVGWQAGSRVDLGGALSLVWNRNELRAPYVFQTQAPLVGLKTLLDVETHGIGWSASAGVRVRPHPTVTASLSWRSGSTITTRGGAAGDASAQFAALGLAVDGRFEYRAAVANAFPSMLAAGVAWTPITRLRLSGQLDRWGWQDAFSALAITLTEGTNSAINGLVGSSTIAERVPLDWRNQVVRRVGAEYTLTRMLRLRGGYAYSPSPVPDTTLTPMTAAIVEHTLGIGASLVRDGWQLDIGYHRAPMAHRRVGDTALQGAEYDRTAMGVGVQGLVLGTRLRF